MKDTNRDITKYLSYSGWAAVILIVAIPVFRWFNLNGIASFEGSAGFFLATGKILGIIALCLYATNFILSTRLKIFDYLFGGINKANIAHHIIGGLALIILLAHPIFMALQYAPDNWKEAALLLLPKLTPPYDWALTFGRLGLFATLTLLYITFYMKLTYEKWLWTHRFMGVAFLLVGLHVYLIPSDVAADGFLRFYMVSLIVLGLASYGYRTVFGKILVRRKKMVVSEVSPANQNSVKIIMKSAAPGTPLKFEPGQFVFVRFHQPGIPDQFHPFSLTSEPGSDSASIIVKKLGDFTQTLPSLKPGTPAEIEGAFGRFGKQVAPEKPQIWVAGGIGITPFLSMAKNLQQAADIELYYAVEDVSDLVEYEELLKASTQLQNHLRVFVYPTKVQKQHITADYIAKQTAAGLAGKEILICGPPIMMKSLRGQFKNLGVANNRIHSEEFSLQ